MRIPLLSPVRHEPRAEGIPDLRPASEVLDLMTRARPTVWSREMRPTYIDELGKNFPRFAPSFERLEYIFDCVQLQENGEFVRMLNEDVVSASVYHDWFFGNRAQRADAIRLMAGRERGDVDSPNGNRQECEDPAVCTSDNLRRGADYGFLAIQLRMERQRSPRGPCLLRHMRMFVDHFIGPRGDLVAAKKAAKRALLGGSPDKYATFPFEQPIDKVHARETYNNLVVVRELLADEVYGDLLYQPRRVERGDLSWKQTPLLLGDACVFLCCAAVNWARQQRRGAARELRALRERARHLVATIADWLLQQVRRPHR